MPPSSGHSSPCKPQNCSFPGIFCICCIVCLSFFQELSGTGDSQRDSRESFAIEVPFFYSTSGRFARFTRIFDSRESPESCESIRANHATKFKKLGVGARRVIFDFLSKSFRAAGLEFRNDIDISRLPSIDNLDPRLGNLPAWHRCLPAPSDLEPGKSPKRVVLAPRPPLPRDP